MLAAAAEVGRSVLRDVTSPAGESPESVVVTALNGACSLEALGRKHLCSACPAGFPTLQALRSHRQTTHGLGAHHQCPQCNEGFPSKKSFKLHLSRVHPQVSSIGISIS